MHYIAPAIAAIVACANAQKVCTSTPEVHPSLSWSKCTSGGCSSQAGSVVIDANWRWTHAYPSGSNCYTGNTWDATLCPDDATCAKNCCLDGANYQGTYGVETSQDALTIGFVTGSNVGSRLYLMASDTEYETFTLLGNEFTFDVDVSGLPCGLNGALYFVSMAADGGVSQYPGNKAGAKYGTGYCDSQCPRDLKFINGLANVDGWQPSSNNPNTGIGGHGSCCSEMDIWEANSVGEALTPHPCETVGQEMCTGDACGGTYSSTRYGPNCDPDGCDWNPYRLGNHTFYGPGSTFTLDTTKKFTVVTQFAESGGALSSINRFYVQNGIKYTQPNADNIPGFTGNAINEAYCSAEESAFGGTSFSDKGGLAQMSKALSGPMVLVLSLWDDYYAGMDWLDSTYPVGSTKAGSLRGTCATNSGDPKTVEGQHGSARVVFSNIRFGPIGSTTSGSSGNTGGTTGGTTAPPATTSAAPTGTEGSSQTHYGQCGGQGWTGPSACASPYTCSKLNDYYSQCL